MKAIKKEASYKTSIGYIKIIYQDKILYGLSLFKDNPKNIYNEKCDFTDKVYTEIQEYLAGSRKVFDIPFEFECTEFQKKVYLELYNIKYSDIKSYKDIAISIGNPKAYRAVGNACNRNPIPFIIPCHRVILSTGKHTGYAYGQDLKEKLINLEKK